MRVWLLLIGVVFAARRPRWEPRPSVIADYNLAVEALNALAFAPAEQVLRSVIAQDPGCGLCRQTLAITLVRQERPDEALQLLGPLAEAHPKRPEVFSLISVAAIAAQHPEQARAAAAAAVALEPEDFAAQRSLLRALLAVPDLDAAQDAAEAARAALTPPEAACLEAEVKLAAVALAGVEPLLAACAELGDEALVGEMALKLARAQGDLAAVLRLARAQRLAPLMQKAQAAEHLQAGELHAAMQILDEELTRRPGDLDALLLRAWCWQALAQPAQAEQDLVRLLSQPPTAFADERGRLFEMHSWRALRRRAMALYVTLLVDDDRAPEARRRLEAERPTLGEGPALSAAEVTLLLAEGDAEGASLAWEGATGRWDRSEALASVAIRLDGETPLSASGLVWLQSRADPGYTLQLATQRYHGGRYDGCQDALTPLLGHPDPEVSRLALQLAHRCAVADEDLPSAQALLAQLAAVTGTPTDEAALRHAWLLGEAGQDDAALALLGRLSPPPGDARTQHRSLSVWLLTRQGRLDEAIALSESGDIEPAQLANLAVALYEDGQRSRARGLMQSACDQMPAPDDARRCAETLTRMR